MTLYSLLLLLVAVAPLSSGAVPADLRAAVTGLARRALAHAIDARQPTAAVGLTELGAAGPAFVTVVLDGTTRACQGSLHPTAPSLGEEIVAAAERAARGDGRHPSLTLAELSRARVIVSLPRDVRPLHETAGALQPIDPRRFGLAIETANGAGVLLPGEARTFAWMVAETRRRAGVSPQDLGRAVIFRTTVLGEAAMPPLERP